ncbi:rhodopsin-like [Tubulanus polymorphus]|uniref:rhodopsin-like n=1 Tax=Tubulanus polymorphus TaxID=672921 RepID=UPI003DA41E4E
MVSPTELPGSYYLWFYLPFLSLLFIFGFAGNFLIVIIMRQRQLWRQSFSRIFVQLAICDSVALCTNLCMFLNVLSILLYNTLLIKPSTRIQCVFFEYNAMCAFTISPWTLVLIATERMCVVCFPFRGPRFWTPTTATGLCLSVACLVASIYSYLFVTVDFADDVGCTSDEQRPMMRTMLISVVPFCFLVTLSSATSVTLFRNRGEETHASKYSKQVTVMVLSLCAFFMITTFPASIVGPFSWNDSRLKYIFSAFTDILMLNYSANLYIYLMSGKKIRNLLRKLLCN